MNAWTGEQVDRIAAVEELKIATPKRDGTLRLPIPIWVVRHGDALYVRSYLGEDASWYRGAQTHNQGHISAGDVDADVSFNRVTDEAINAEIDAAYRVKYGRYGPRFLDSMTSPAARAATLQIIPQRMNS